MVGIVSGKKICEKLSIFVNGIDRFASLAGIREARTNFSTARQNPVQSLQQKSALRWRNFRRLPAHTVWKTEAIGSINDWKRADCDIILRGLNKFRLWPVTEIRRL
jgi:predicted secreted protein